MTSHDTSLNLSASKSGDFPGADTAPAGAFYSELFLEQQDLWTRLGRATNATDRNKILRSLRMVNAQILKAQAS